MVAQETDVVIIGGGLVGGTLAIALGYQNLKVLVVDRETPEILLNPDVDGRTTAVSFGSKLIFENLGIWESVKAAAEPILDIRAFERHSPWAVYYNHRDVGNNPLGYIVENTFLRQGIFQRAAEIPHITWVAPAEVAGTERILSRAEVKLTDGRTFEGALVVGAEGRLSPTREKAGLKTYGWRYDQMALIAHIRHEKAHEGSAWEIFQPQGPLAILPLTTCATTNLSRSGIVWTSGIEETKRLVSLDDDAISQELQDIFPYFGKIHLSGKRWTYPLSSMVARNVIDHRLAIVGDAAHTIHPVAGQGVNLGWRDAQTLASVLGKAKRLGLDIGSKSVLQDYQRQRRLDTASVLAMSDGMVRLFSNHSSVLSFLRNTGLGIVNQIPPLKRRLMRHAMGILNTI